MTAANDNEETIEGLRAARRREVGGGRDPRWTALAMGALPADDTEALRRADPELHALYRPFDAAEDERLLAALAVRLAPPAPSPVGLCPDGASRASAVVPIAWWRRSRAPVAGALAVAAAAAFVFLRPAPPVEMAWSEQRGGAASAPHLSSVPGSAHERLAEMIVPVSPARGRLAVRGAALLSPGRTDPGRIRPWSLSAAPTDENVVILSGTRRDLFPGVPRGEWDMVVAIGRPGPALSDDELVRLSGAATAGDVQVLKKRVVLEGPCVGTAEQPCRGEDGAP